MNKEFKLGQKIDYTTCYAIDCGRRFKVSYESGRRHSELVPLSGGSGLLMGIRNMIMADYRCEWEGSEVGYLADGKKEQVLLVVSSLYRVPVVVRKVDVVEPVAETT